MLRRMHYSSIMMFIIVVVVYSTLQYVCSEGPVSQMSRRVGLSFDVSKSNNGIKSGMKRWFAVVISFNHTDK